MMNKVRMKVIVIWMLMIFLYECNIPVMAKTYQYGYLDYELTSDQYHVVITGCKAGISTIKIPKKIDDMDVIGIGSYAFSGNTAITSISMPCITYVNNYAFYNCDNLKIVDAPLLERIGESAFVGCDNLTNVKVGYEVSNSKDSYIVENAFDNCKNLKTINTGNIQSIKHDYYATGLFSGCDSLISVDLLNVKNIDSIGTDSITTFNAPIAETIESNTFSGCTKLTKVTIPRVREIGSSAFYDCKSLKSISIPLIEQIGDEAFVNTGLTKFIVKNDISYIGDHAIGFNFSLDKYNRKVWTNQSGFKIHCTKDTNAYMYAKNNEFSIENHTFETTTNIKATCIKNGKLVKKCKICNRQETTTLKKLGHIYNAGVITKKATNTKNGVKTFTCKRCKVTKKETIKAYKTLAQEKYQKFLSPKTAYYYGKIVDVDGNGIPELLLKYSGKNYVYSYDSKTGKMVKLISSSAGKWENNANSIYYSTKYKKVGVDQAFFGGHEMIFYKINGCTATKTNVYTSYRGSFKINGKTVKEKEFNKLNLSGYITISGEKVAYK